jgi:hypothetical protein
MYLYIWKRGKTMNYLNKIKELKELEEQKMELVNLISELYQEITEEEEAEDVEKLKKQGYYHAKHNPWSEPPSRGYYIKEPHPKHKEWYKSSGPYYGD